MRSKSGTGRLAFFLSTSGLSVIREEAGENVFPVCCITVQLVPPWALQLFVYHRVTGTGVGAACVCAFVLRMLRMCHRRDVEKVRGKTCAVAGSHTPLHCTIPPPPSGLRRGDVWFVRVPLCWVDRRGTMASLCCLSVWPPSCSISVRATIGFWLCEACWPGLCLLVTDPLCPQCLQLVRPLRAADYPTVIGAWALADQRCPADCGALVIFHSLMLCSLCLLACSSVFLPAQTLSLDKQRKVCRLYYFCFSHKKWHDLVVFSYALRNAVASLSLWMWKYGYISVSQNQLIVRSSQVQTALCPTAVWLGRASRRDTYTSVMWHAGFQFIWTLDSLILLISFCFRVWCLMTSPGSSLTTYILTSLVITHQTWLNNAYSFNWASLTCLLNKRLLLFSCLCLISIFGCRKTARLRGCLAVWMDMVKSFLMFILQPSSLDAFTKELSNIFGKRRRRLLNHCWHWNKRVPLNRLLAI